MLSGTSKRSPNLRVSLCILYSIDVREALPLCLSIFLLDFPNPNFIGEIHVVIKQEVPIKKEFSDFVLLYHSPLVTHIILLSKTSVLSFPVCSSNLPSILGCV